MRKLEDIKKEREIILNILRQNGGEIQLSDLSEKFRSTGRPDSRKTIFKRLRELQEMNTIVKQKRGTKTVVVLIAGINTQDLLIQSTAMWYRLLQDIKKDFDKIHDDKKGLVLSSVLVSLTCDKTITKLDLSLAKPHYLRFMQAAIDGYDDSIRELTSFVEEKCKQDDKLRQSMAFELAEVSSSVLKNIGKYLYADDDKEKKTNHNTKNKRKNRKKRA